MRVSCLLPSVAVRDARVVLDAGLSMALRPWYFPSLKIHLSLGHFFFSLFMISYCLAPASLLSCLHFLSHDASTLSPLRSLPVFMFSAFDIFRENTLYFSYLPLLCLLPTDPHIFKA